MARPKKSTEQRLLEALAAAWKRMPQTDTPAYRARLAKSSERLDRLLAQAFAWQDDLAEGLIDEGRDELLERIDAILEPMSPKVKAQRTIVRAVILARQDRKDVAFVRQWVESYGVDALRAVDDGAIANAIARKPLADASILKLLAAAGVPQAGRNPARTIRKYGYGN